MTDTATSESTTTDATTEEKRRFDVDYTLEIMEGELPAHAHGGGGGRTSPLELKLEELKGREDAFGKWVLIGKYGKSTAAGAAANVLRQRHGRTANAEGFEFAYRKIDQNGSSVNGLFVRYDPTKIVEGALDMHRAEEKARLERLEKARKEREAAEANGPTAGDGAAGGATGQGNKAVAEKVAAAQKAAANKK